MSIDNKVNDSKFRRSKSITKKVINVHKCKLCGVEVRVQIDSKELEQISSDDEFPFPHLHLHGKPLHAMLCYVDKQGVVKSSGFIKSIEILRNSETFQELTKKFSSLPGQSRNGEDKFR